MAGEGTPRHTNRLIHEKSPYLLQHAHNPVDWHPWGTEALDKARQEDKMLLVSIGYATCHWCHVMERESFENEEVARYLNERFVPIKVDREERPDVDKIFMDALHALGQQGGWPLNMFATPDGRPVTGGTYFPPVNAHGRRAFRDVLELVADAWQHQRPDLLKNAEALTDHLQQQAGLQSAADVRWDHGPIDTAAALFARTYDRTHGGFGLQQQNKFPPSMGLMLLLRHHRRTGEAAALEMVETTLQKMLAGGIYDQVGGGFHRYSTDARWLVPHFEKMLYNQAHLARAYLEAYRVTGDPLHERVARQTLDYVLRDMTSPEGGFYSATDADSEDVEGEFFVWTPDEIRAALPPVDADFAIELFGVTAAGNFEGKTILHLPRPLPEVAGALELPLPALFERVDRIRRRLYEVRERRVHPLRDDKIVTAWNGMMITSLARAGDLLGERRYLEAAERAMELLWRRNRRPGGSLWRVHLDGSSSVTASLEDYAYIAEALVSLYDATGRREWLERADATAREMVARFHDRERGGFFMSEDDEGGRLIARPKSPNDGAIPSGNSVAVRALALLAARTGESEHRRHAETALAAFAQQIGQQPSAFAYMLLGADELLHAGAGPLEYGANGTVRAKAVLHGWRDGRGALAVELETAEGWHVNAHRPLQDFLIPTELALAGEADGFVFDGLEYSLAETVILGF